MPNENTYHIPGQCSAKLGEMSQILKQQYLLLVLQQRFYEFG